LNARGWKMFCIKCGMMYRIKRKGSMEDELPDSESKSAKIRPIRVEMYCRVVRCRFEISHQVRNDGME